MNHETMNRTWVQCTWCHKWRRVPTDVNTVLEASSDATWTCAMNADWTRNHCDKVCEKPKSNTPLLAHV